jgi:electron transfer flavoprotein alpha subunit
MTEAFWLPQIDARLCTGCGDCVVVCPAQALALLESTAVLAQPDACNYCAECEAVCPVAAIALPYQIVLASSA